MSQDQLEKATVEMLHHELTQKTNLLSTVEDRVKKLKTQNKKLSKQVEEHKRTIFYLRAPDRAVRDDCRREVAEELVRLATELELAQLRHKATNSHFTSNIQLTSVRHAPLMHSKETQTKGKSNLDVINSSSEVGSKTVPSLFGGEFSKYQEIIEKGEEIVENTKEQILEDYEAEDSSQPSVIQLVSSLCHLPDDSPGLLYVNKQKLIDEVAQRCDDAVAAALEASLKDLQQLTADVVENHLKILKAGLNHMEVELEFQSKHRSLTPRFGFKKSTCAKETAEKETQINAWKLRIAELKEFHAKSKSWKYKSEKPPNYSI